MADQVLLSADRNNIEECIDLALDTGVGVELMTFAYPDVLDGNWKQTVSTYNAILRPIRAPITLHGPFMDLVSGSPDELINHLSTQRYQHAIYIASELGIKVVNLHANFIGSLHNNSYRRGWHERNVGFWHGMAEIAKSNGVTIVLENMWEYEPSIIGDVLREVNHPNLKACLDVGHARVFGDKHHTIADWINHLTPWLIHTHLNNNNGIIDEHYGFDWEDGVLDYNDILPMFRKLENPPYFCLEMWQVSDMRQSLSYFQLDKMPQG